MVENEKKNLNTSHNDFESDIDITHSLKGQ